jgi:ankyrin repeat protein
MNSTRLFLSLILTLLLGQAGIQTVFTMNNNNDKKRDISKLNDDEGVPEKKQKVEQQEEILEINWNQKLIEAAQNGNNEQLMKAIQNGADVNYKNIHAYWGSDQRRRACDYVVNYGHFDCLETLIENNAEIYDELIIEAVMVRNIQIIKFLLEHGANPNACIGSSNGESSLNPFGERILMDAAARGYAEIVELLIAH